MSTQTTIEIVNPQEVQKKQHTSHCLRCKKDYTYDIEFEGIKEIKNGAQRCMVRGMYPQGHRIRTFVKKSKNN